MHETVSAGGEVLARLSHLEPLLDGRRVLVLGSPEDAGASAVFLSDRGAAVPVVAPDEVGLAPPFDRIVIHPRPDRPLSAGRVRALRDLLAPGGLLAVALPVDDQATESLLREAFPSVEAAAVLPLSAWAVVPEGAAPREVTWDGTFLASPRPASRLLLCGERPTWPRAATVLAMPPAVGAPPVADEGPDLAAAAAAERAEARAAEAAAEVIALSWRRDELEAELSAAVAERDALRARAGSP